MNRSLVIVSLGVLAVVLATGSVVAARRLTSVDEIVPREVVVDVDNQWWATASLADVRIFAAVAVGYAAEPSLESMLFREALDKPGARAEMLRLVASRHPAPALYGLCGLRAVKAAEFDTWRRTLAGSRDSVLLESGCIRLRSTVHDLFETRASQITQFDDFCDELITRSVRRGEMPGHKGPRLPAGSVHR